MIAKDAGLTDYRAGAMVHKEMRSEPCARVQIHAWPGVRPFRHDARDEWDIFQIELMCQPLHGDGFNARVRHDDFFFTERSRIAIESRLRISLK